MTTGRGERRSKEEIAALKEQAVTLSRLYGLSLAEIGRRLHVTPERVRKWLHEAEKEK